jgi:hypothetical protein
MRSQRPLVRLTPRVRGKGWRYYAIAPLIFIAVGPFILAYKVLLGWWLDPLSNKHYEKKLQEQVRTDLAFIFRDFCGQFVANGRTYKNEIVVTIETADLHVVVAQHHGDYAISVAPRSNPEMGESLRSVLKVIYETEGSPGEPQFTNLAELGELFRLKFNEVQAAVSREHFSDTIAAIDKNHQLGMQKMAQMFNRPDSYFDVDIVDANDLIKKNPE